MKILAITLVVFFVAVCLCIWAKYIYTPGDYHRKTISSNVTDMYCYARECHKRPVKITKIAITINGVVGHNQPLLATDEDIRKCAAQVTTNFENAISVYSSDILTIIPTNEQGALRINPVDQPASLENVCTAMYRQLVPFFRDRGIMLRKLVLYTDDSHATHVRK